MKRVAVETANLTPNFIGSWVMEEPSLCDNLMTYFETHTGKQAVGTTSAGTFLHAKDRTDISIAPFEVDLPGNEILKIFIDNLFACYKDYLLQWPFLKEMNKKLEVGAFNFGRYQKGQHFQGVHAERMHFKNLHRVFAWMTYLNDVEDGGETYFTHYDLSIKPKKGLTIIWPAEWTHAHRGNVLYAGSKYMITGWMSFRGPEY